MKKNIREHIKNSDIFNSLSQLADKRGVRIYLVGGYVRDIILDRKSKDIDILVVDDGVKFAEDFKSHLKGRAKLSVFKNFGTANLKFGEYEIEFVGARKESYRKDSRKPSVKTGSLEDDLTRRDFTINALAISLNNEDFGSMIDMFDGMQDINNKLIRTPREPLKTFSDDPLRMLRAIRFASQLSFSLTNETFESIIKNVDRLEIISVERIADELNKILMSQKPSVGFDLLYRTGLLNKFLPEVVDLKGTETVGNKSHKDNFYHTLEVLDNIAEVSDNLWLRWVALLHDVGKPVTKKFFKGTGWTFHGHEVVGARMTPKIFKRLKLPANEKLKYVRKLVSLHLRPVSLTGSEVTDSAVRRLIVDAGEEIDDLLTLCRADITSKNPGRVSNFLSKFDEVEEKIRLVEEKDELRNWKNPISGEIIMKVFNIAPSKEVGLIKEEIKEAIMEGDIQNDYDQAYKLMLNIGIKMGLRPGK